VKNKKLEIGDSPKRNLKSRTGTDKMAGNFSRSKRAMRIRSKKANFRKRIRPQSRRFNS